MRFMHALSILSAVDTHTMLDFVNQALIHYPGASENLASLKSQGAPINDTFVRSIPLYALRITLDRVMII